MARFWTLKLDRIEAPARMDAVRTFLKRVQGTLKTRYPAADGYRHEMRWSRNQSGSTPGPLGFELLIQRGETWGVRLFLGEELGHGDVLSEFKVAGLEGSRLIARAGFAALCTAVLFATIVAAAILIGAGSLNLRAGMVVFMMAGIPAAAVGAVVLTPMHWFMTRKMRPDLLALGEAVEATWAAEPVEGASLKPRAHPFVSSAVMTAIFAAATAACYAKFMWGEGVSDGMLCFLGFGMVGCGLMLITGAGLAISDLAGISEGPGVFGADSTDASGALTEDGFPDLDAVFDGFGELGLDVPDLP